MCGIIGIVGATRVTERLVEGLKRLEYRGYDSSGVAVLDNGVLKRQRAEGKIKSLVKKLGTDPVDGSAGIAHTRWATHGVPNETNAHPHFAGRVGVVHNGIIENFLDIRKALGKTREFTTETDTEVVAHLVDEKLNKGQAPIDAFASALKDLHGAYALGLIIDSLPDHLFAARAGSPLAIGIGNGEMYLGSDAMALAQLSQTLIYLEEGDWAVLTPDSYRIFDKNDNAVERPKTIISGGPAMAEKGNYRHFMLKEIYEQSETTGRTLSNYIDDFRSEPNVPEALNFAEFDRIIIIACGTAYYAGMVAKYWFEQIAGLAVDIDVASEFRYRQPINAGPEIGVASTKAFTSQLTALAALTLAAGKARKSLSRDDETRLSQALTRMPGLISEALKLDTTIDAMAFDLSKKKNAFYLGRGPYVPLAHEGALKLKEISYIHAEGYAAGELKHGPIALIEDGTPVIVIAPYDGLFEKTISNLQEVASRGAHIILITDAQGAKAAANMADDLIIMPKSDNFVAPIIISIAIQLLAYHTAVHLGTDVDQPRNLAKSVTVE